MTTKYSRWTLAQRASLAQTVAANAFADFSEPKFRGAAWTPDNMPSLVESMTLIACLSSCINPKHHASTCKLAVDFYNKHLAKAMEKLFHHDQHCPK